MDLESVNIVEDEINASPELDGNFEDPVEEFVDDDLPDHLSPIHLDTLIWLMPFLWNLAMSTQSDHIR